MGPPPSRGAAGVSCENAKATKPSASDGDAVNGGIPLVEGNNTTKPSADGKETTSLLAGEAEAAPTEGNKDHAIPFAEAESRATTNSNKTSGTIINGESAVIADKSTIRPHCSKQERARESADGIGSSRNGSTQNGIPVPSVDRGKTDNSTVGANLPTASEQLSVTEQSIGAQSTVTSSTPSSILSSDTFSPATTATAAPLERLLPAVSKYPVPHTSASTVSVDAVSPLTPLEELKENMTVEDENSVFDVQRGLDAYMMSQCAKTKDPDISSIMAGAGLIKSQKGTGMTMSGENCQPPPTTGEASCPAGASPIEQEDADAQACLLRPKHAHLVEVNASVTVERMDPSSPLYSVKDWKDLKLDEDLLKGIYQKGFNKPSKIQEAALPLIVESNDNLIGQAQSGSGKTATFSLSMLSKVRRDIINPQALCLCPTRELARQNLAVIEELGMFTQITTFLAVPQCLSYHAKGSAQIIVGTPGKTMELLKKRMFPVKDMKLFVLDEADEMIDHRNNMAPQVVQIRRFFQQDLQVLLFSATYSDEVRQFANTLVPCANKIQVKKEDLSLSCIRQFYIEYRDESKRFPVLSELYGSMTVGQSVIFVNSRETAFKLTYEMQQEGHAVSLICGTQPSGPERMEHSMRDQIMNEFRSGETKVLICTDVLSRGIDVPQVTLVINYDLPLIYKGPAGPPRQVNMETYIHRIGRTGRFGLKGIAINFVNSRDMDLLRQIRDFYCCEILPLSSDPDEIEEMVRKLRI